MVIQILQLDQRHMIGKSLCEITLTTLNPAIKDQKLINIGRTYQVVRFAKLIENTLNSAFPQAQGEAQ